MQTATSVSRRRRCYLWTCGEGVGGVERMEEWKAEVHLLLKVLPAELCAVG